MYLYALVKVPFEAGRTVKICLAHSIPASGHVSTFIELISYIRFWLPILFSNLPGENIYPSNVLF